MKKLRGNFEVRVVSTRSNLTKNRNTLPILNTLLFSVPSRFQNNKQNMKQKYIANFIFNHFRITIQRRTAA